MKVFKVRCCLIAFSGPTFQCLYLFVTLIKHVCGNSYDGVFVIYHDFCFYVWIKDVLVLVGAFILKVQSGLFENTSGGEAVRSQIVNTVKSVFESIKNVFLLLKPALWLQIM